MKRRRVRDVVWDVRAKLGTRLGLYTKYSTGDGKYYYVSGPGLPLARFVVIREDLEHQPEEWTKDWMTGEPAGVLWFSFWKLKVRERSRATYAEADWYRGFVEVDRHRRESR